MDIKQYIQTIDKRYRQGITTEHSFRGDLQQLIETLAGNPKITATNEPKRIECGAPDYVVTHNDIPVGYIEAKDIGIDLNSKTLKEQFGRYRKALDNLIITDYLEFRYYIDGEYVTGVEIAEIQDNKIVALPENFDKFTQLVQDFCRHEGQTIRQPRKLAELMAAKARLMGEAIEKALDDDSKDTGFQSELEGQMLAFKEILIHDITPVDFADIYAQTIAYGMFAARLHDKTLEDFSRQEAAELIPKSNPFLRKLFQYIAANDLDERIRWIVEALVDIFRHTDVASLLKNFGKATAQHDPIIHFYETFLSEYDPALRKSRGVWYTPEPVVNFIVRAVDDILKNEFGIAEGLADRSKIQVERSIDQSKDKRYADNKKKEMRTYHKVQILDPATGTGTFLSEVIKHIHHRYQSQQGMWNGYVEEHLIPRLNGFELLMASYAMAHLKMDMLLAETGFAATKDQRFRIYLTNSLEESHPDTGTLWASWLANEANEANEIKRNTPVMCVMGNPPYSGESANKGKWILDLLDDYKKEPGGKSKLKERNPKMLNDDYVKFIRYGQHYIEKNGEGVLAYINPHGFLDNPTFRGMRWNLLKTYDKIYIIDLHGNTRRNESCPDGSKDENVFDIMQGVSINIFVKTGKKAANELGEVYHYDLYGRRHNKYDFLWNHVLQSIPYQKVEYSAPMYYFVPKNFKLEKNYNLGFLINKIFIFNSSGITTSNDKLLSDINEKSLYSKLTSNNIQYNNAFLHTISYKPFDNRYFYLNPQYSQRIREKLIQNFQNNDNLSVQLRRTAENTNNWQHIFITKYPCEGNFLSARTYSIPLYLYPDEKSKDLFGEDARRPNLDEKIVAKIAKGLKLRFTPEKSDEAGTFAPIDLLDYIYAVLHSPTYRETYKEFLKVDFPRVPYPTDAPRFWQLAELGGKLRKLHLLEPEAVSDLITGYPQAGDDTISRKIDKNDFELTDTDKQTGRVWINDQQYFDQVPLVAWEFYIGGYQPAQKWLKDRREQILSFDDILHYQQIILALKNTNDLMKDIDNNISI